MINFRSKSSSKAKVSGKRHLVHDNSLENNTEIDKFEVKCRRWGRLNQVNSQKHTVTNKFGPIAPLIFYTLLAKFGQSKETTKIWGGPNGVHLISKLIITLATIVQSSAFYPGTNVLASDLYTFSWSFKDADDTEVRQAVLLSLTVCIPYLSDTFLVESVYEQRSLIGFLNRTQNEDADFQCRNLAKIISSSLSKALIL